MLMDRCQHLRSIHIENGSLDDYHRLAQFHYKASKPATVANIYRLVYRATTVVGRYLGRSDETQTIGVLVMSYPVLNSRGRNIATVGRYRNLYSTEAARLLNSEMRTISRVIIEPRWCGVGLAVRLVRHALKHAETIYTEALAAMGRVNPFFERAGMSRLDLPVKKEIDRLIGALSCCGIESNMLGSKNTVEKVLRDLTVSQRNWMIKELRRWVSTLAHYDSMRVDVLTVDAMFDLARAHVLGESVYYLYRGTGNETGSDDQPFANSCEAVARLQTDH